MNQFDHVLDCHLVAGFGVRRESGGWWNFRTFTRQQWTAELPYIEVGYRTAQAQLAADVWSKALT